MERKCFRVVFKNKKDNSYYEVHLSPKLDWNVYHLDSYRSNLKETDDLVISHSEIRSQEEKTLIHLGIKRERGFQGEWTYLTPVVWKINDQLEYFSFAHPEEKADFHDFRFFKNLNNY